MTDEPGFPIPLSGNDDAKADGRKTREWTAEQRKAFGEKMRTAKAAKRAERGEGTSGPGGRKAKAPRSARPSAPASELEAIETSLVEGLTKFGAAITPVAPIPGVYTIQTAEDVSGALTRLAAKNPALLKALSGSSTVMDYVAVGMWGVGMFVAVSVQTGRIPADSIAARNFGLTAIAEEFYPGALAEPVPVVSEPVGGGGGAWSPFEVPVPPDVAEAEARAAG